MRKSLSVLEVGKNELSGMVGKEIKPGVVLLTEPSWDGKWTAIANVGGMLCLVEVSLWREDT